MYGTEDIYLSIALPADLPPLPSPPHPSPLDSQLPSAALLLCPPTAPKANAMFLQDSLLAFSALILAVMLICSILESVQRSGHAAKGLHLAPGYRAESSPLLEKTPVPGPEQVRGAPTAMLVRRRPEQSADLDVQV